MANQIAEALGVDIEQSRQVPQLVMAEAFFNKLAEFNIVPRNDDEQLKLWQIGEMLEAQANKVASATSNSVLDHGLNLLQVAQNRASGSKTAAAQQADFDTEVQDKTAMYLDHPEYFAHGLALFSEQALAAQDK